MRPTTESRYLSDFPQHPLCDIAEGARLEGEAAAGVCFVGIVFLNAMAEWRSGFSFDEWPPLADDELEAIGSIFKQIYGYVDTPPPGHLGGGMIPRLAASYLERLAEVPEAMSKFRANDLTVFGIMADFAGTLGYETSMTNVLDGWEMGAYR